MTLDFRRQLTFLIRGELHNGELRIIRIEKVIDRDRWACFWSLSFVHPEEGQIFGSDPLDSLFQCLDFVGNLIRGSEKDGLIAWWQEQGDRCGLSFSNYPELPNA